MPQAKKQNSRSRLKRLQPAVAGISSSRADQRGRIERMVAAAGAATTVYRTASELYTRFAGQRMWTVEIESKDGLYQEVVTWLLDQTAITNQKRVKVSLAPWVLNPFVDGPSDSNVLPPAERPAQELIKYSDESSRPITVFLDGHKIKFQTYLETPASQDSSLTALTNIRTIIASSTPTKKLTITATSAEGRAAIDRFLEQLALNQSKRIRYPRFAIANSWGSWSHRDDLPLRPLDTVILRRGQKEAIVQDLEEFLGREDQYARLGAPWHRGYLFHGPPGTGKTSIAKGLASHFCLDVFYIPLADISSDTDLMRLVAEIRPRSILLLEDIDVTDVSHNRADNASETGSAITLSGLLNTLDGVGTPHGLITILTTNRRDVLDAALLRPGRVDAEFLVDYIDAAQVVDLWKMAYGTHLDLTGYGPINAKITPAEIIEIAKRWPEDCDDARTALRTVLSARHESSPDSTIREILPNGETILQRQSVGFGLSKG